VIQLGTIVYDREKFHNYRYIWPVGFETTRSYFSIRNPEKHVLYRSRILDGGDGPIFQVTPEDDPDNIVTAPAASAAWTTIMRKVNEARNKEHTSSASGPEYFGFGYPPIARLIQEMPNADKCKEYIIQNFEIFTDEQQQQQQQQSIETIQPLFSEPDMVSSTETPCHDVKFEMPSVDSEAIWIGSEDSNQMNIEHHPSYEKEEEKVQLVD
jgi:hypothetical protein